MWLASHVVCEQHLALNPAVPVFTTGHGESIVALPSIHGHDVWLDFFAFKYVHLPELLSNSILRGCFGFIGLHYTILSNLFLLLTIYFDTA